MCWGLTPWEKGWFNSGSCKAALVMRGGKGKEGRIAAGELEHRSPGHEKAPDEVTPQTASSDSTERATVYIGIEPTHPRCHAHRSVGVFRGAST